MLYEVITEEIVVKPVAPILRHISMFSGNTILGDEACAMVRTEIDSLPAELDESVEYNPIETK